MIDLIIFDCDGVLVDSEILAAQVLSETLESVGFSTPVEEVLAALVGLDARATRSKLETMHAVPMPADFEASLALRLNEAFEQRLKPIEGIVDLLRSLDCLYCVASNSGHERLQTSFAATGLAPLVAGRVFSAEDVAEGKPAPDLFLHAARMMGRIRPECCLVIEDSVTGVTAARAAGMRVIGFCGASHIRPGHDLRLLALGAERIYTAHHQIAARPWLSADGLAFDPV
ncbi:HAD family hydrolase [Bosea thiooxidans]